MRSVTLPVFAKKNKTVISLEKEPNHSNGHNDNLYLLRCVDLHRRCDQYRLEPTAKMLYEAYDQDDVAMEDFAEVMLDDLYLVEFTFEANVCIYQLVESDEEDGKTTAELVRRSLCHYPKTFYVNIHKKYFYRCRKCGDTLWKDA